MTTLGRFEILAELGRGGMGVVYRAHDPDMGRNVAIKLLRVDGSLTSQESAEIARRFEREAKAAGGLNHPNVVGHYERGEFNGHRFIVMELVDGPSLHHLMTAGPRPSLPFGLSILAGVASALDYAHGRGVIHRDIKPANILLQDGKIAKVADFGIAKCALGGSQTATSVVLGSPHYMAPEQIEGQAVTARSDQWSLAVTAYETLAGRRPFESDSVASLFHQILAGPPRDPGEYEPGLNAARLVFERALHKTPDRRYETCTQFVQELNESLSGGTVKEAAAPVKAPSKPAPVAAKRWTSRFAWPIAALVVLLCGGLGSTRLNLGTPPPAVSAAPAHTPAPPQPVAPAPTFHAGQTRFNRRDGQTYLWVPAGSFRMGCSAGDVDCHPDETPHQVVISRGFWIGQTEVTVAAYQHFTAVTGTGMPPPPAFNPKWKDGKGPISRVTWDDATSFCNWAQGRLPTEAEWEFAARAGSSAPRYGALDEVAWYKGNSKLASHQAGLLQANALGLYDTLGNVWEWTADRYGAQYYAHSPESDPHGPDTGDFRVLRGGSWIRDPAEVRVSIRYPSLGSNPDHVVGLRCAANELP